MKTCKDCIRFEACYYFNHELKKYPDDFLYSDNCTSMCTTFRDRSELVEAKPILDYLAAVKSRILTSSPHDQDLYAVCGIVEHIINKNRLLPGTCIEDEMRIRDSKIQIGEAIDEDN